MPLEYERGSNFFGGRWREEDFDDLMIGITEKLNAYPDSPDDLEVGDATATVFNQPVVDAGRAVLAQGSSAPIRVIGAGSSSMAGSNASQGSYQFFDLFIEASQKSYPNGGTEKTTVWSSSGSWAMPTITPGIQGFNKGKGSTTSADYILPVEMKRVQAIVPHIVFHMIGTNDQSTGAYTPTQFKANIKDAMDKINLVTDTVPLHYYLHTYPKEYSVGDAYQWPEYLEAAKELIELYPDRFAIIDFSAAYRALGYPGANKYKFIDTDNVHQTNQGHRAMASMLVKAFGLPQSFTTTLPVTGRTRLWSEGFSANADPANAYSAANTAGGTGAVFNSVNSQVRIDSGALKSISGTNAIDYWYTPNTQVTQLISALFSSIPVSGAEWGLGFSNGIGLTTSSFIFAEATAAGVLAVKTKIANVKLVVSTGSYTVESSDRVTFEKVNANTYRLLKNGILLETITSTVLSAGVTHQGYLKNTSTGSVAIDNAYGDNG